MTVNDSEEWSSLNPRQQAHAEALAELALEYGKFDQSTGADGAHYAPAAKNPFRPEGLVCQNCVFFDELSNGCQIVTGSIEPGAVCKLWVIPENKLALPDGQVTRGQLDAMTPAEIMKAKAEGRLKALLGN